MGVDGPETRSGGKGYSIVFIVFLHCRTSYEPPFTADIREIFGA